MAGYGSSARHGMIPQSRAVTVTDEAQYVTQEYLDVALSELLKEIKDAARILRYKNRTIDEYRVQTAVADSEAVVSLPADFERIDEIIESVLIVGPASTAFTMQIGARNWSLITNAQGFCLIAPVRMKVGYSDPRILTGSTAGDWTYELMGRTDDPGRRY